MERSFKIILFIIAVIATTFVVTLNEYNIKALKQNGLSNSDLVKTADDLSYRVPPENFLRNGKWKDNRKSEVSYVMRPPGYGFVIFLSLILDPENPEITQKIIQILFFLISVLLFGKILSEITNNLRISLVGALTFGLMPCYSGFVYYSITEAFTPMLILLLTFLFLKIRKRYDHWSLISFILVTGMVSITRIQLIIFPVIFMLILIFTSRKYLWVIASFTPLLLWQIRVHHFTSKFDMHPIYSENNLDEFRPPHRAMTDLFRIWEYRSDQFHSSIHKLSQGVDSTNLVTVLVDIPEHLHNDVRPILKEYQSLNDLQKIASRENNLIILKEPEESFIRSTERITRRLALENFGLAYVITPFNSLFQFFNKSYLNLYVFQKTWRGNLGIEVLRLLCFSLVLISFITVLMTAVFRFLPEAIKYISSPILLTILYLMFVQRLNEERYLVPILPLALVVFISFIHHLFFRTRM